MSPNTLDISAGEARSKFAFLFSSVAELYRFYYEKKPSTKFEDIKAAVEKLKADNYLSEYLVLNLEKIFNFYPTLLPGVVAQNYKVNATEEQKRLNNLGQLLDLIIGDICGEINEKVQEMEEHDKEYLDNWLMNQ